MIKKLKLKLKNTVKDTKKLKTITVTTSVVAISLLSGLIIGLGVGHKQVEDANAKNKEALTQVIDYYKFQLASNNTYKDLYEEKKDEANQLKMKVEQTENSLNYYKENVAIASNLRKEANRGSGTENLKLNQNFAVTTEELNKWIDKRAPKDSPFRGQGKIFIEASKESGLDPMYLVAHAGLESKWGTSEIAREKNNYYGIGAFNASPMESSKTFGSGLEQGIVEGAVWISKHYTEKGQDTLSKMLYNGPAYAQTDNGEPLDSWLEQIVAIYNKK